MSKPTIEEILAPKRFCGLEGRLLKPRPPAWDKMPQ